MKLTMRERDTIIAALAVLAGQAEGFRAALWERNKAFYVEPCIEPPIAGAYAIRFEAKDKDIVTRALIATAAPGSKGAARAAKKLKRP